MDCPTCGEPTFAVRSLPAGRAGKAVERRCAQGHRWTYAVQLVGPIERRGDGPSAVASKLAKGENPVPSETDHD